jgi:hypothetical protein
MVETSRRFRTRLDQNAKKRREIVSKRREGSLARSLPNDESRGEQMKKIALSIVCLMSVGFGVIPVGAQTRCTTSSSSSRRYERDDHSRSRVSDNQIYRNDNYDSSIYNDSISGAVDSYGQNLSVWDTSRDKITTTAGAGGGAIIGGLFGGSKGAIIGAIAGGGAAALYTYKIRDKYPQY